MCNSIFNTVDTAFLLHTIPPVFNCFERIIVSANVKPRYQAFTSKEEAEEFADSIRRAHKLIGNIGGTDVTVTKMKNGL